MPYPAQTESMISHVVSITREEPFGSSTQLTNNMSCSLQPLASQLQTSCTALLSELQAAVTNADDSTFTTSYACYEFIHTQSGLGLTILDNKKIR